MPKLRLINVIEHQPTRPPTPAARHHLGVAVGLPGAPVGQLRSEGAVVVDLPVEGEDNAARSAEVEGDGDLAAVDDR